MLLAQVSFEIEKRELEKEELNAGLEVTRHWGGTHVTSEMLEIEISLLKEMRSKVYTLDNNLDAWVGGLKDFCSKAERSKYNLKRNLEERDPKTLTLDSKKDIERLRSEERIYRRINDELSLMTNY